MPDLFCSNTYKNDNVQIHIININTLSNGLSGFIDTHISQICDGISDYQSTINTSKNRIKLFLESKTTDTRIGAIAEFFIHLYMNNLGYKQECLFLNLEENSIKKGFDGYYSLSNETWIAESKAGHSTTENMSHENKIKTAYTGLKNKISGEDINDPWGNAFNHAKLASSSRDILQQLKKYSDDFINDDKYHDIKDFNICPCSTIFYYDNDEFCEPQELIDKIKEKIANLEYRKIIAICINKKALSLFENYLQQV